MHICLQQNKMIIFMIVHDYISLNIQNIQSIPINSHGKFAIGNSSKIPKVLFESFWNENWIAEKAVKNA